MPCKHVSYATINSMTDFSIFFELQVSKLWGAAVESLLLVCDRIQVTSLFTWPKVPINFPSIVQRRAVQSVDAVKRKRPFMCSIYSALTTARSWPLQMFIICGFFVITYRTNSSQSLDVFNTYSSLSMQRIFSLPTTKSCKCCFPTQMNSPHPEVLCRILLCPMCIWILACRQWQAPGSSCHTIAPALTRQGSLYQGTHL